MIPKNMKPWKETVRDLVRKHCNSTGSRTFSLCEFTGQHLEELKRRFPDNNHPEAKIRQQLQSMRDDNFLVFEDNHGHYTLRDTDPLENEVDDPTFEHLRAIPEPEQREYIHETFARNQGWVLMAKKKFGQSCMLVGCSNNFRKEDGSHYVEVHHIKPLFEGGTDGLWNLSVVCAHHHRMAHFAARTERSQIRRYLEKRNAELGGQEG